MNDQAPIPDQNELRYAYEHAHDCYLAARRLVYDLHCDADGRPTRAALTSGERRILLELERAEARVKDLRHALHVGCTHV